MQLTLGSFCLLIFSSVASAGPIQIRDNVIRHANDPAKRYMVNEFLSKAHSPPGRRQASPQLVTGVEASSTTTRKGTEDGSVPAVGVGGDNTSLLSFLTFPSSPSTTTVTTIVATPTTDTDGSGAESVTSSAGENTGSEPTQAPSSGTAMLSGAAQTETELQSQAASTTTIQVQTTILKTVQVTAEATAAATTTNSPAGEVEPSTTPVDGQQGQQQQGQQPSATVTVVFVTAAPTFTGPTAGFTTLTPSEPASGSTVVVATTTVQAVSLAPDSSSDTTGIALSGTAPLSNQSSASGLSDSNPDTSSISAITAATAPASTTAGGVAVVPVTPGLVQGRITVTVTVTTTVTAR